VSGPIRKHAMVPKRVILIVLDSVGVGALPDAAEYGDEGANTLRHVAEYNPHLKLPQLISLGLGNIGEFPGLNPVADCQGAFGKMSERSRGKDTITGHWEIAGLVLEKPFKTFPNGFPRALITAFEQAIDTRTLGNLAISGTEVIEEYGQEHMCTGYPIVYTSADSVFQIAAHEDIISVERLYEMCRLARQICHDEFLVARIIARPFRGVPGNFIRTERRRDYAIPPVGKTVLDFLSEHEIPVCGIGKIEDIFVNRGLTHSRHTGNNHTSMAATLETVQQLEKGLIFVNLVDFDMKYGHRNDVAGYAQALEQFDCWLPELKQIMTDNDMLIITADHGCDPATPGTDHTREYVPLLAWHPALTRCIDLGVRTSFTDIAQTVADFFLPGQISFGTSFLDELR